MTEILFSKCDGGKKGESCRKTMEIACENFFGCGVKKIEDACNDRREKLMREWGGRNPNDPMLEYCLSTSFGQGVEEITPPFDLYEPETIEVYILEGDKSQGNEGLAPMEIGPLDEGLTRWKLYVYLDVMDYANNNLRWTGFRESIEEITYHELLHASGDSCWRGKHDGILRHNLIGITCVKECLHESLNGPKTSGPA